MQELVSDYTIVIVTHNMQQAARVSRPDGVLHRRGARGDGAADGHGRRVRPDRDDLHEPARQADRGLRHGAVRLMAAPALPRRAREDGARSCSRSASSRAPRCARPVDAVVAARRRACRAGHRRRRRDRPALPDARPGHARAARAAGAGRRGPAARLGDHALEPAPRADRGPGGEHREDLPGHEGPPAQRDDRPADRRDGRHRRRDGPDGDGRASPARRGALHDAAEDGRSRRPAEPQHALRGRQARRRPAGARLGACT